MEFFSYLMRFDDVGNEGLTHRVIQLLMILNKNKINTLDGLNRVLGIPKPTLHRLLKELMGMQLVTKHEDTHYYSVTSHCQALSCGVTPELRFIEKASIVAHQLTEQYEWPVAIATAEEGAMLIRFSSRPDARFSFIKSTVGKRFPLMGSALGEAWLSQRPLREQKRYLREQPPVLVQRRLKQLKANDPIHYLQGVQRQGYALRYGKSGESSHIAVPLMRGRQLMGVMGMSVFTNTVGENIVPLYLHALKEGIGRIK